MPSFFRVMKSIEFGENDSRLDDPKSLEVLLLEKNKSCQSENTSLKLAKQDLEGQLLVFHFILPIYLTVHHTQSCCESRRSVHI